MQIFTRSQRQWQARPVSLQEAEGFYRAWQRSNVRAVVSHASYLINIASPDAAVRAKSAAALREEVERCRHLKHRRRDGEHRGDAAAPLRRDAGIQDAHTA